MAVSAAASKSKSTSRTSSRLLLGPEGEKVQDINLSLAEQQLRVLLGQESFQNQLYETGQPEIDRFSGQLSAMDQFQRDDLSRYSEFERSGFAATPEQKRLIAEATESALKAGQSDINQGLEESLGLIRSELAPGLGLRPGDSPLIDRGGLLAREALRQSGLLSLGLRGQQAKAELEYPLAASETATGIKDFQASLQDSAFRNRLALTGLVGQGGLGLGKPESVNSMLDVETGLATQKGRARNTFVGTSAGASYGFGGSQ